jgi:hypothetical protein
MHTEVFEANEKHSDIPLDMKCYGPAKITPARSGGEDTVKAGWMFVRPKAEGAEDGMLTAEMGALPLTQVLTQVWRRLLLRSLGKLFVNWFKAVVVGAKTVAVMKREKF